MGGVHGDDCNVLAVVWVRGFTATDVFALQLAL